MTQTAPPTDPQATTWTPEEQLKKHFGFDSFKPGQKEVIEKIRDGRSAAAIFPTGSGKSLCYQLPAVQLPGMTLLVSPLLALMKDQSDFLSSHNIPAARLDSTIDRSQYNATFADAKAGRLKIMMVSPERFKNERFRNRIQQIPISLLAIDEAHCISEWGHNFRPEYLKLAGYRAEFGIPQTLLLTATATREVVADMRRAFDIAKEDVVSTGFYRENLFLQISPVSQAEKKKQLLARIEKTPDAPAIIYTTLQKTAENVAKYLCKNNVRAEFYHAGIKHEEREAIQNRFMDGRVSCIVATIAFGMGIDKKDIRRIIHYDLPKSIEGYSQEIGRSGRDGQPSLCEVLANKDNLNVLENFVHGDVPENRAIRSLMEIIHEKRGAAWEVKLNSLSRELDIRILPLKTLLVYLDVDGVITPVSSHFKSWSIKYMKKPLEIIDTFQGERARFVEAIFKNCHLKSVWAAVDFPAILGGYDASRQRVMSALEYFQEKNWIELKAAEGVDVYDVADAPFDPKALADKMIDLFEKKKDRELARIEALLEFFQSDVCLNKTLAHYFGEDIEKERCGHCSVCQSGPAVIKRTQALPSLDDFDFAALSAEFQRATGDMAAPLTFAKFLCGLSTPLFSKLKIGSSPSFGRLERHPFAEVAKRGAAALVKKV